MIFITTKTAFFYRFNNRLASGDIEALDGGHILVYVGRSKADEYTGWNHFILDDGTIISMIDECTWDLIPAGGTNTKIPFTRMPPDGSVRRG